MVSHLYSLRGQAAADQLLRVTAGLDSMIVGEAEVQGQVKRAYELALVEDATGPVLEPFRSAAPWRGQAGGVGDGDVGGSALGSQVAVELAQRTLGDLEDRSVPSSAPAKPPS